MSYQVLARKWRPKNFAQLVGQEHVVRALSNGLASGRLHHAFLFTGTRGVGKTTIARIIAKALNCETGITAEPCGRCHSCVEIDQGRYPDLMEIDAASRTKVDDTREVLDNVIYAPSKGRFKVYLIDEVHMLSISSFNALLKTLEEPPEHVKFVLATTDPQKLPATVLSRCLKFHLRRLTMAEISTQMAHILSAEQIAFEAPALAELARAADGSMRDGLSLLDQAIGFGAGAVRESEVRSMLGTASRELLAELLLAVVGSRQSEVAAMLAQLMQINPSYHTVCAQLLELLHDAALIQVLGADASTIEFQAGAEGLAAAADKAQLQLMYQLLLNASKDIQIAPDARIGFEMAILRLLAFEPDAGNSARSMPPVSRASPPPASAPPTSAAAKQEMSAVAAKSVPTPMPSNHTTSVDSRAASASPAASSSAPSSAAPLDRALWQRYAELVKAMALSGPTAEVLIQSEVLQCDAHTLKLKLLESQRFLMSDRAQTVVLERLREIHPEARFEVSFGNQLSHSLKAHQQAQQALARAEFVSDLEQDPVLKDMQREFAARIIPESIVLSDKPSL